MKEYQRQWEECLRIIREKLANDDIYSVWFAPVECECYDGEQNVVLLQVPSIYVYHYLEQYQVRLLSQALGEAFYPGVRLSYRIADGRKELDTLPQGINGTMRSGRMYVAVPDAEKRIRNGLEYFLGSGRPQWLPAYDKVAEWLADNRGRGLLCVGTSGLGKTLLCQKILPVILGNKTVCVSAQEMNSRIDELLSARCVIIDDLGKEPVEAWVNYKKRTPFFELCDAAEQKGILLIVTTNLSTTPVQQQYRRLYPSSIEERYGREVLSRLRATTRMVLFEGSDMRR